MAFATTQRSVLMCSEHEPLSCHRCLLLGRSFVGQGVAVRHILRSGQVESHQETEARLLDAHSEKNQPPSSLRKNLAILKG